MDSNEFARALGNLEGKMDQMIALQNNVNDRVVIIEKWQWRTIGFVSAWSAIAGVVLTWMGCK